MTRAAQLIPVRELCGLPFGWEGIGELPATKRRCKSALKRAGLPILSIPGRGGEAPAVDLDILPENTQIAYLVSRNGRQNGSRPANSDLWASFARKPPAARQTAERRLAAVRRDRELRRGGLSKAEAERRLQAESGVTPQTLRAWRKRIEGVPEADWLPALAPAWKAGGRAAACSDEAWDFFLADYARRNAPWLSMPYERTKREAARRGWAWPSYDTIRRRWRAIPEAERVFLCQGQKALETLYPPQHRDVTVFTAMQGHNYDALEPSVLVEWPDGHVGRPVTFACQDVYSKRLLAAKTDRTENAALFRHCFACVSEDYGYPEFLYIDNTRAAANKQMTGGVRTRYRWKARDDEPLGVLPRLGIKAIFVTPEHGQAKPIERGFRDLKQLIERDPRCAGAYSGDDPRERDGRTPRPIPLAVYGQVLADAVNAYNARPGRRTQACKGKLSFDEAFAESYASAPVRRALPEHRAILHYAWTIVRCRKQRGEIVLHGQARYWTPELVNHRGRDVLVRYDPHDLERGIVVETADGRPICEAPCLRRTGFNDTAEMREHKRLKRAWTRDVKRAAESRRKFRVSELAAMQAPVPAADMPAPSVLKPTRPEPATPRKHRREPAVPPEKQDEYDENFRASVARLREQKVAGF